MFPCKKCTTAYNEVHYAARNGHHQCLNSLLEYEEDLELSDAWGETPLTRAAEHGNYRFVRLLIEAGADVNYLNQGGTSALLYAIECGNEKCVETLIEGGAQVDGATWDDYEYCKCFREEEIPIPLINAADWTLYPCIQLLIRGGADVNISIASGTTALMQCAKVAGHRSIQLLLKAGADVNKKNEEKNYTALTCAAKARFPVGNTLKCVQLLLGAGARVNNTNNSIFKIDSPWNFYEPNIPENCKMLLLAAGETADKEKDVLLVRYINEDKRSLMQICRDTIRKHLLDINLYENLFVRIPKLKLPSTITDYLLYDISLDADKVKSESDWTDYDSPPPPGSRDSDPDDDEKKYFTYPPWNVPEWGRYSDDDNYDDSRDDSHHGSQSEIDDSYVNDSDTDDGEGDDGVDNPINSTHDSDDDDGEIGDDEDDESETDD